MTPPAGLPPTAVAAGEDTVDGRTARRDRNRDAVLDAVIELFTEGAFDPVAADVAERSGVSLRSVYRYFDDLEALARAAIARQMERFAPLAEIADLGDGPLGERIDRIVASRIRLYEAVGPTRRAALLRAPTNPLVREQLEYTRELLSKQVDAMFAPELHALSGAERREVAAGIDLALGFDAFEHLHRNRALSGPETQRVIRRAISALLR